MNNSNASLDFPVGLYRPEFERDNCGFGMIAQMDGEASHRVVATAITALARLTHRGAVAADGKSGDGCGLLMKQPDGFLRAVAAKSRLFLAERFAAGLVFLNPEPAQAQIAREILQEKIKAEGLDFAGWRVVPTDSSVCGVESLRTLPLIEQAFVNAPSGMKTVEFERRLFLARRKAENALSQDAMFYIPSLSSRLIAYKGLVMPASLSAFYTDLADPRLESSICVFHQRFSTNTLPQWKLCHPFRYLAHNGEINTVAGNRSWAKARARKFQCDKLPDIDAIKPIVSMKGSDSSSLDNMLEVLLAGGMDVFQAMRLLIPPAWQNIENMDSNLRAFYEYSSKNMEPWDGPAGVVLTDGRYAACTLDRNGLRPARYVITKDRLITLASEIGVYDYAPEDVVAKGRLRPGQMLAIDTKTGEFLQPKDVDTMLAARHPYKSWLKAGVKRIESKLMDSAQARYGVDELLVLQKLFNVSSEEREQVIRVLAEAGQEAVGSMGDDVPFAVLSQKERPVYDYFRQQFAQVTNPPIDPLREQIVMSLETTFGAEYGVFEDGPERACRLIVDSPVLSDGKFAALKTLDLPRYQHATIDLHYSPETENLTTALDRICQESIQAVRNGKALIILSDRNIEKNKLPIAALLATGAVHHALMDAELRCDANLIIETASARDPHHVACLIGYGATAVYPYLAFEILYDMVRSGEITGKAPADLASAFRKGINKGLLKIMSKMGISTIGSYRGAQLFEIVGLNDEVVDRCFTDTVSRLQGAGFEDIEQDQKVLAARAWNPRKPLDAGGIYKFVHGGEYHAYNPDVIQTLHEAVQTGDYRAYQRYAALVNERPVATFRDLLRIKTESQTPISLEAVEPLSQIYQRFDSAGMSLGALSPEAHEALAIAMNRLGGRSNSGEGGEDPKRYGTDKTSKIKQIASGRFGVTPHYLVNAEVLQIKVAQGAKPGEGGQLPGDKVNETIAGLRYAKQGIALISPPPHHDIYSIEDLAQLIFDLKQVNPQAQVSVKLVAGPGVGTIAAGVAKAYADLITISGYDGGTGASPLTSVRYAGTPWELGLSETHQTLRRNDLRGRVRVQTDGGLKTGLDVIKAAILGAESFGFGTAPMVALGCKYLRICHLNNCATGVATQNKVLRLQHFIGLPEMVMNFFQFVAMETRDWLAALGVEKLTDLIGRTDLLEILPGNTEKQQKLDLMPLLADGALAADAPRFCQQDRNPSFDEGELAEEMVRACLPAIENKTGGVFAFHLQNSNRSIGARLSGEIARRYGNLGMNDAPITLNLTGTAGQSFGVWNAGGLHLSLEGDANDYVGKGMAGGKIVIRPPTGSAFKSQETAIVGNTCLYGATSGTMYAAGTAGERFAVRNSGATAIVEGVGDHGCEYMTGGVVVVLGSTGVNFGAGMTGGFAYVLDQNKTFVDSYNHELIDIHRVVAESMEVHQGYLRSLIEDYVRETQSAWGQEILDNWRDFVGQFWLIKPRAVELSALVDTVRLAA